MDRQINNRNTTTRYHVRKAVLAAAAIVGLRGAPVLDGSRFGHNPWQR